MFKKHALTALTTILVNCFIVFANVAVFAEETEQPFNTEQAFRYIKNLEHFAERLDTEELKNALAEMNQIYEQSLQCVKNKEVTLDKNAKELEALGEQAPEETKEIAQQRNLLTQEKTSLNNQISRCKLLSVQTKQFEQDINEVIERQKSSKLFRTEEPTWKLISQLELSSLGKWLPTWDEIYQKSGVALIKEKGQSGFVTVTLFLIFVFGLWLQKWATDSIRTTTEEESPTFFAKLFFAIKSGIKQYGCVLIVTSFMSTYILYITYGLSYYPFMSVIFYGALVFFALVFVNHVLLSSQTGQLSIVQLPEQASRFLRYYLNFVAFVLWLAYIGFVLIISENPPLEIRFLLQDFLLSVFVFMLILVTWLIGRISVLNTLVHVLRWVMLITLVSIIVAEFLGYRNLAISVMGSLFKTIALFMAFWLINALSHDFFEGFAEGKGRFQNYFRYKLGLKSDEKEPGVFWLHFIMSLALWMTLVLMLMHIWGVSDAKLNMIYDSAIHGFTVGKTTIHPVRILSGIVLFGVLLISFRFIRDSILRNWFIRTGVERGRAEAATSIIGYLGFILAAIIALSTAGLDFTGLAIIAGGLSVGVGFGLQNVVNNFISGIILLFERPIKTGDWILVGETAGFVRKVSIRSTLIRTFDRSDVIIPNSELTTNQVTNMMLKDNFGRVIIPVGVAYGSDTDLVKKLLLEISPSHPEVIMNGLAPEPEVFFCGFGESSLDFELRVFVYNIDQIYRVKSTINFAIDKIFRENGIEIPFPKRDLYIKEMPKRFDDDSSE